MPNPYATDFMRSSALIDLLEEEGPLSTYDIMQRLDLKLGQLSNALYQAKRIRPIKSWRKKGLGNGRMYDLESPPITDVFLNLPAPKNSPKNS